MSGRSVGKRPDTDAQWARDVEQRLRTLEGGRAAVRVRGWVITEDDAGELVATTAGGRRVELTKLNPEPENTATPLASTAPPGTGGGG